MRGFRESRTRRRGSSLFGGAGGSPNFALAMLGIFALGGGLAILAFGRRSTRS